MRVSDAYSGKFMSVIKWPTSPEEHTITDIGIEEARFDKREGGRIIYVRFDKQEIKYRVNVNNAESFKNAWGEELEGWLGKRVTIHRLKTRQSGAMEWEGVMTPVSPSTKPRKGKGA